MLDPDELRLVGLIPAAGRGSRLHPLPIPKELYPMGYQDYLVDGVSQKRLKVVSQYVVESMIDAGAQQLIFILGNGKHQLMEYYGGGSRFGPECVYLFQEELSGMPGALGLARSITRDALVLFGMPDTIFEPRDAYRTLLQTHCQQHNDLTLGLFPTDRPHKGGMVDFDDEGRIRNIIDKPKVSPLKFTWGTALWGDRFSDLLADFVAAHRQPSEMLLGDVFMAAIVAGMNVRAWPFKNGSYFDIGTPDELNETIRHFHL